MRQVGTILSQSVLAATVVLHSLVIFLHPTASAIAQQTARGIYLFSVRNSRSTSGDPEVAITITRTRNYYEPPNGDSVNGNESSSITQQTYFIPNRSLSSECGDQYFRCQNLSVETFIAQDGGEVDIVFVPLENGVLLVSVWCDYCTGMLEWSEFIVDSPTVTCSPTVIYKSGNSFYTVCVSTRDPYMYASVYHLDFRLNGSEIESGSLSLRPLTAMTFMTNQTLKLSYFLVEVSSQENKVYFAVGGSILVLDVLNPTMTKPYPQLPDCSQINKLVLLSDESSRQVIAFCNDRVIHFDPVYGDWTRMYTFSTYGIPFLCPSSSYKVTFFNDESRNYLQLSDSGSVPIIIHNVTVSSGICFEIQNRTYFAYSDQQQNNCVRISLYDFYCHDDYQLISASSEFSNATDHPRFFLMENRFLVIYTEHYVFVLDAKNNFSPLINISQDHVSPFTVLTLARPVCMTTSTLSSTFNTYTNSTVLSPTSFKLISRTTPHHTLPCTSCNDVSSKVEPRTTSIAPTDNATTPNTKNHQVAVLTGVLTTGAIVSVIIIVSLNVVIGIFIKFRRKLW